MVVQVQMPQGDAIEYLCSFASAFEKSPLMAGTLLGMGDSIRQAKLFICEPLGMFALLTAEEEAASFLYYALKSKGYSVPDYGKLHRHNEKFKLVIFAEAIHAYFFDKFPISASAVVRIENDEGRPKTTFRFPAPTGHEIVVEDPLTMIVTTAVADGNSGHNKAVQLSVDEVLEKVTPKGFTLNSHIKKTANRRNLCLYGDPKLKSRVKNESEVHHFTSNCVAMITFGFLIYNSEKPTTSMSQLVNYIFKKLAVS